MNARYLDAIGMHATRCGRAFVRCDLGGPRIMYAGRAAMFWWSLMLSGRPR